MFKWQILFNMLTILIGTTVGTLLKKQIPEKLEGYVFMIIGGITFILGTKMALKADDLLVVFVSAMIGGIIGFLMDLEKRTENLIKRFSKGKDIKVQGIINPTLLFVIGPMTIIGCLEIGLGGKGDLIVMKSIMDGISSIMFTLAYGPVVYFSAFSVWIIQGLFVELSRYLLFLKEGIYLNNLIGTGGLIILLMSFGLMRIKDPKTLNLLPGLLFAPLFTLIFKLLMI